MVKKDSQTREIDAIIKKFTDWRGERLEKIRSLIKKSDPEVVEEVKWKKATNPDGIPVWSHDGMICTGESYKNHLRLTFANGNSLSDPEGLFNSFRAIIIHKDDKLNEAAFKKLINAAVVFNQNKKHKSS